jgi:hypothetical protein
MQYFRETGWNSLLYVFSISRQTILPCLLFADSLISWIFHHTQPIGIFAQQVSVLFGHFSAAF